MTLVIIVSIAVLSIKNGPSAHIAPAGRPFVCGQSIVPPTTSILTTLQKKFKNFYRFTTRTVAPTPPSCHKRTQYTPAGSALKSTGTTVSAV